MQIKEKEILNVLKKLEEAVDKDHNKKNKKGKLNEAMIQELYNWFMSNWNGSTSVFTDAYGSSDITHRELFRLAVYFIFGFPATVTLTWALMVGKFKELPGKLKKLIHASKIINNAETSEQALGDLKNIGVDIKEDAAA